MLKQTIPDSPEKDGPAQRGQPSLDLWDTLGTRGALRRDVDSNGSRELSIREPSSAVADTGIGLDLTALANMDLPDNLPSGRMAQHNQSSWPVSSTPLG